MGTSRFRICPEIDVNVKGRASRNNPRELYEEQLVKGTQVLTSIWATIADTASEIVNAHLASMTRQRATKPPSPIIRRPPARNATFTTLPSAISLNALVSVARSMGAQTRRGTHDNNAPLTFDSPIRSTLAVREITTANRSAKRIALSALLGIP